MEKEEREANWRRRERRLGREGRRYGEGRDRETDIEVDKSHTHTHKKRSLGRLNHGLERPLCCP